MQIYGFDRYGGPEVETFLEVATASACESGLLLQTIAVGLNPADIKVRAGLREGKVPVRFPMAMGREAAGIVVSGPSGTFRPGDRVFGSCAAGVGALGDLTVLDPLQAAPIPDHVTPQQAAVIPVAIGTAWDALHELQVGSGDTVLVLGAAGGVGIHAVQLARHLGATVIAAVRPNRLDFVAAYDVLPVDTSRDWSGAVLQHTPDGVTAVIDAAGGDLLAEGARLLRHPERLRSTASPTLARQLGGSAVTRRREAAVYAELATLVAQGHLHPVIERELPFHEAPRATESLASGHAIGKLVINR